MLDSVDAGARRAGSMSAKASVFSAVICIERVAPAITSSATVTTTGVSARSSAQANMAVAASVPLTTITRRKPKRRSSGVVRVFIDRLPRK